MLKLNISKAISLSLIHILTVIPTDAPSAVYVGLAATLNELNPEEKEAATWMPVSYTHLTYQIGHARTEWQ